MFLEWTRFSTSPFSRVTSYLSREVSTRTVPFALPPEGRYTTTLSPALTLELLEPFLWVLEAVLWLLELTLRSSVPLSPLVVSSFSSPSREAPPFMPADSRLLSFRAREPLRSLLTEWVEPLLLVLRCSRDCLSSPSPSSCDDADSDSKLSLQKKRHGGHHVREDDMSLDGKCLCAMHYCNNVHIINVTGIWME